MKLIAVTKLCFATGLSLCCSFAETPTIGVASALGTFSVNDAKVEGNANIFSGSQIKTDRASSRVYLQTGAALTLGTNSVGTLYNDHLLLQQGSAKVDSTSTYGIQAGVIRIRTHQGPAQAVVRLSGSTVQVASLSGSVDILNGRGLLLNRLNAGNATEVNDYAGATTGQSGATAASPPEPTAGQIGEAAGQSGASAQTPATTGAEARRRRRREEALYLTLGVALAGLGLATDAILQPGAAPTSP